MIAVRDHTKTQGGRERSPPLFSTFAVPKRRVSAISLPFDVLFIIISYASASPRRGRSHGGYLEDWLSNGTVSQLPLVCKAWNAAGSLPFPHFPASSQTELI
jgi:hypothetical protein